MSDQNNATLPQDPATAEGVAEDKGKGKAAAAEQQAHDTTMDEDDDDDSSSDEEDDGEVRSDLDHTSRFTLTYPCRTSKQVNIPAPRAK